MSEDCGFSSARNYASLNNDSVVNVLLNNLTAYLIRLDSSKKVNKKILPALISITQFISFGRLYYVSIYWNSHISIVLIESTIVSLFNFLLLIGIFGI